MNAIELADLLDDTSPWIASFHGGEAAALLRSQYSDLAIAHEAIVKLRAALESVERRSRWSDSYINDVAEQALKDTEDLK